MSPLFAFAVVISAMGGCRSFSATEGSDAGPGTDDLDAANHDAPAVGDSGPIDSGPIEGVPPGGKLVFVTTATAHPPGSTGNFVTLANAVCTSEAAAAGRAGSYVAWLATAAQRAIGRLPTDKTWFLRNGVKIGEFKIFDNGAIPSAIDRDAMGLAPVGDDHAVWTGTLVGGDTATDTCDDWSLSIGSGEVGDFTLAGAKWASNGGRNCAQDARFYCFEK